jgi:large subunit ribosomal protein L22
MESKATVRFIRMSPRKARLVVDTIRGKSVPEALAALDFSSKAAARTVRKVLKSAVANAENNQKADQVEEMRVEEAFVNGGPMLKRFRPRAMGRAGRILKRTSHITIVLSDRK